MDDGDANRLAGEALRQSVYCNPWPLDVRKILSLISALMPGFPESALLTVPTEIFN